MNFGSKFVYVYDQSDEECISDSGSDTGYSSTSIRDKQRDQLVFASSSSESADEVETDSPASFAAVDAYQPPTNTVASAGFGSKMKKMLSFKKKKKKKSAAGSRLPEPMDSDLGHDGEVSAAGPLRRSAAPRIRSAGLPQTDHVPKKTKKVRKADPNVLTISVGDQVKPVNKHRNSKKITCTNCKAVLPSFSQFEVQGQVAKENWTCEFCNHFNRNLDVTDWFKPSSDDVTFELVAPTIRDSAERKLEECHNVIFVIDISGSMSTTKQCNHTDSTGRRTMTFVSRLDAVRRAAEHQLTVLHRESPNVRVGLITFGTEVVVYGDGTTPAKRLNNDAMRDQTTLKGVAGDFPPLKPLKETFNKLSAALARLDIKGMTALGPGLLSAISLAANVRGSKVIICTDGCANLGFGTLPGESCQDEFVISESRAIYRSFGDYARDNSVSVSVISLEGTDCRLVHLGLVAQITGGIVDIVDPADMNAQFGNVLASKVLATDVTVTLCLHHSLYIRDYQSQQQRSGKVEHFGNVAADTEMVVEFGVKTVDNENEQPITIDDEDREEAETDDVQQASVISTPAQPGGSNQPDGGGSQATNNLSGGGNQGGNNISGHSNEGGNNLSGGSNQGNEGATNQSGAGEPGTSHQEPPPDDDDDDDNFTTLVQPTDEMDASVQTYSELPFQLQIEFTLNDGGKYLRVITNLRECTKKREAAESEMNMNIVGQATSNTVSNVALAGDYVTAKHAVKSRKKMTQRFAGHLSSDGVASASARDEAVEYMDDLNDLDELVTQQERHTKKKMVSASAYRRPPASLRHSSGLAHDGPSQLQHDGVSSTLGMQTDSWDLGYDAGYGAPPPFQGFGTSYAANVRSAGIPDALNVCTDSAPPPPPQSAGISAAGAVNAISDDLAYKYYARSKGAYKKKQQS